MTAAAFSTPHSGATSLDEARAAVHAVGEVDRAIAINLCALHSTACARPRLAAMLADAEAEALARHLAPFTLGLRRHEAGLAFQLRRLAAEDEAKRHALETVAGDPFRPVAEYAPEAKAVIEKALGRSLGV